MIYSGAFLKCSIGGWLDPFMLPVPGSAQLCEDVETKSQSYDHYDLSAAEMLLQISVRHYTPLLFVTRWKGAMLWVNHSQHCKLLIP